MGAPQIILIALYAMSLGLHLAKHGETQIGRYNFFTALISCTIVMLLLKWGGFFG